jgi:hypothetical protein
VAGFLVEKTEESGISAEMRSPAGRKEIVEEKKRKKKNVAVGVDFWWR